MAVGLDIGSKTIKIVELDKSGASWYLKGSGVVGYNGNSPESIGNQAELAGLAQIIKKLHKEAGISTKYVNIALPEQQVFTRTIKFPLLSDQEIASAVKWESEQYIPIPIADAVVQHQIIERRDKLTPQEVLVLLVAAPKTIVHRYLDLVLLADLEAVGVESELMSSVRSLSFPDQTVMIVDFGAKSTDIAIARNQNLVFTRSVMTGGEAFTRAVSQGLGVDVIQAEEYKKTYGLSSNQLEGKVKSSLDPIIQVVTDEIKKAVHYYQTEESGDLPRSVIVSGGTAGTPNFIATLSQLLGMEVLIANPFNKVQVSSQVASTISNFAPLYSVAVGAAMKE